MEWLTLQQIADELHVDALVQGSALRDGDRVRITTQLIRAAPEEHLWAESYERDSRDVLTLQAEIAGAVAREIKITLTPQEAAHLARARPVNPEAYEAYLKGQSHWYRLSREHLDAALGVVQTLPAPQKELARAVAELAAVVELAKLAGSILQCAGTTRKSRHHTCANQGPESTFFAVQARG